MLYTWLNPIGDRNPQLFRELKGHLKPRGMITAIVSSVLVQVFLIWVFLTQLPSANVTYSRYCGGTCIPDAAGNFPINWQLWWLDLFRVQNWILPFFLFLTGAYVLMNDLQQEEKRGTLNFIRLSPRSSYSILTGKLFGVPILIYLAIALALPLHWVSAIGANAPFGFLLSYYLIVVIGAVLFFSIALLTGFVGRSQVFNNIPFTSGTTIAFLLITLFFVIPFTITWTLNTVWQPYTRYLTGDESYKNGLQWFYLPIADNLAIAHLFTIANLLIGIFWVWQALNRCFHSPSATLFNKLQSYGLIAYLQILLAGFFFQRQPNYTWNGDLLYGQAIVWCSVSFVSFLALIAILSNHRQAVLDWAHSRRIDQLKRRESGQRSVPPLWKDLVLGEKSPALVAIALNMGIFKLIYFGWLTTWSEETRSKALLGLIFTLTLLALYAVVTQLLLLMKTPKRATWATSIILLMMILPSIIGALITTGENGLGLFIFLFSPFFWLGLELPGAIVFFSLALQWLLIGVLTLQLIRQVKHLGEAAVRLSPIRSE